MDGIHLEDVVDRQYEGAVLCEVRLLLRFDASFRDAVLYPGFHTTDAIAGLVEAVVAAPIETRPHEVRQVGGRELTRGGRTTV